MTFTKNAPLDKEVALEITQDFLEKFEFCCNQSKTPVISDLEKYLSRDFHLLSNGKTVSKSLIEYLTRIEKLQQKYSHLEITDLTVDTLSSGYRIVVRYTLRLTPREGNKRKVEIMAIATLKDHRFTLWDQVANEQGAEHWDQH